jgi:hypothetical protein
MDATKAAAPRSRAVVRGRQHLVGRGDIDFMPGHDKRHGKRRSHHAAAALRVGSQPFTAPAPRNSASAAKAARVSTFDIYLEYLVGALGD